MLAGLLVAGVLLRLWLIFTWQPAFVGYSDAASYARAARDGVFTDLFRPAGYPVFLRLLHGFSDHVLTVTALQHVLGIATALILYVAVRRTAANPWVALIAPAVILLDGFQVLIEHAVLSDSLFAFLVAVALLALVQAPRQRVRFALLPAVVIAYAATVRTIGLFLVPLVLAALLWPQPRLGLQRAALAAAAIAVVLGSYVHLQHDAVGATGFSRASGWSSYSRVGQFADCSKFTPPAGTEQLCEQRPPGERPGTDFYFWSAGSPATKAFGPPNTNDEQVGAFAHAVIRAQLGDYLKAVGQDFARYVFPEHYRRRRSGETQAHYFAQAINERDAGFIRSEMSGFYPGIPQTGRHATAVTRVYTTITWVRGPLMALLLLAAAAAPLLARERRAALLFSATAYVLLLVPVATQVYDARYALSALGSLCAAAALAVDGVLARRRASAPRPEPVLVAA